MADQEADIPEMDYPAHHETYDRFVGATKYSIIGLVILLILMAAFL